LEPKREVNDDQSLIRAYRNGDVGAFDEIIEKYNRMVFGICWRMLGSVDESEDVTQQVFINVFQKADKFKGKSSFKTWLYSVAINECRNHRRKLKNINFIEVNKNMASDIQNVEDDLKKKQQKELIREEIEKLPFKQRAVINLRINEELTFKEIASILKCSVNSAKVNFQHGLKKIKGVIKGNLL
jgi:RNA polymerase sigma-70 factor (ECF subfamily)